jgi:hypothetical protein
MKTKKKKTNLPALLEKEKAVPAAVRTLLECLTATRTYQSNGKPVTEADYSTRCKSALGLLEFASAKPRASAKDEMPPDKRSEQEQTAEVERILGITYDHPGHEPLKP